MVVILGVVNSSALYITPSVHLAKFSVLRLHTAIRAPMGVIFGFETPPRQISHLSVQQVVPEGRKTSKLPCKLNSAACASHSADGNKSNLQHCEFK